MKRVALFVAGVVLLVGLGMIWAAMSPSDSMDEKFRFEKVSRGNVSQVVTANGTLNPVEIANIGTQVSGTILTLHAEVNDEVKKGQLLAEIDPKLLESTLKQQRSNLEIARITSEQAGRDLKRARELFAKDYIARVELERAEQAYLSSKLSLESAQSQTDRAEAELGYSRITSPIDGVVISREVTEGQTVAASFQAPTLYRIAGSLEDMEIDVTIPESDIGMVKKGMEVTFTVDAYPNKEFKGVVDLINLNPNTGQLVVTYKATVNLRNEERLLLPGMTAYVNISIQERANVLRVPATALRFIPPAIKPSALKNVFDPASRPSMRRSEQAPGNMIPGVHVLRQGALEKVDIVPGMADENFVEIISGDIQEGDVVAVGFAKRNE